MTGVDASHSEFQTVLIEALATALQTSPSCIMLDSGVSIGARRLRSARRLTAGVNGNAGVRKDVTEDWVNDALKNSGLEDHICSKVGTGTECQVQGTGGFTTTTTEMPWGMPWWAWFLICLGICCLFAFCCLPLLGAPMAGKNKSKANRDMEVVYEVYDVPDDNAPLSTAY